MAAAHRRAFHAYVLRRRFRGRIRYFRCGDSAVPGSSREPWGAFATEGLDVVEVPGDHGTFHVDPQSAAVVEGLRRWLRAEPRGGVGLDVALPLEEVSVHSERERTAESDGS